MSEVLRGASKREGGQMPSAAKEHHIDLHLALP